MSLRVGCHLKSPVQKERKTDRQTEARNKEMKPQTNDIKKQTQTKTKKKKKNKKKKKKKKWRRRKRRRRAGGEGWAWGGR